MIESLCNKIFTQQKFYQPAPIMEIPTRRPVCSRWRQGVPPSRTSVEKLKISRKVEKARKQRPFRSNYLQNPRLKSNFGGSLCQKMVGRLISFR
jgi:hypothetical protein